MREFVIIYLVYDAHWKVYQPDDGEQLMTGKRAILTFKKLCKEQASGWSALRIAKISDIYQHDYEGETIHEQQD